MYDYFLGYDFGFKKDKAVICVMKRTQEGETFVMESLSYKREKFKDAEDFYKKEVKRISLKYKNITLYEFTYNL